MKKNIVIATIKSWNINNAQKFKQQYHDNLQTTIITKKEELTYDLLENLQPLYVFFPEWSWMISESICNNFRCVVFHITDLPYGRGGSPLQNLIAKGIYKTKISAIKAVKELDAGDFYMKESVDIRFGSAEEIFSNCSDVIFSHMIPHILNNNQVPCKQIGDVVLFKKKHDEESNLAHVELKTLDAVYDCIRMFDGEGYPAAFFDFSNFIMTFHQVAKRQGKLCGVFEIKQKDSCS